VVTISEVDTERAIEALKCYLECEGGESVVYVMDTWESEFFQFFYSLSMKGFGMSSSFL